VIAAKRTGLRELILPEANRGDFEELQEHIREGMTVHFVERFPEVESVVFHKPG
jgi:ATP-dependent Lon protease